jgi:hypothetical protein
MANASSLAPCLSRGASSTCCIAEGEPTPFVKRIDALMANVTTAASAGARIRHETIGERFAYLRLEEGGRVSACGAHLSLETTGPGPAYIYR